MQKAIETRQKTDPTGDTTAGKSEQNEIPDAEGLGRFLGLMIHDIRNPAATLSANLAYLREFTKGEHPFASLSEDDAADITDAMGDMETGLSELMRGLEHLTWIGRWLRHEPAIPVQDGDVTTAIDLFIAKNRRRVTLHPEFSERPLHAKGGASISRMLEILTSNVERHARDSHVVVRARREGEDVIVEWVDEGPQVGEAYQEHLFTLSGQDELKAKRDGRYGRFAGLFALRLAVQACGGDVESSSEGDAMVFRVRLPSR